MEYSSESDDDLNVKNLKKNFNGISEDDDCLICINLIKRKDKIWSCKTCYCLFHLQCIQRWGNDSVAQKITRNVNKSTGYYTNSGEYVENSAEKVVWDCPQCRTNYESQEIPLHYVCFCGKKRDPQIQEWLLPHTCGNLCQKFLDPHCGHRCVVLCHYGRCPPCPQIVTKSCKCGKSQLKTIRCSQKDWSCNQNCSLILDCGIHKCDGICHGPGMCRSCDKTSIQKCQCGESSKEIECKILTWNCHKSCDKLFSCNLHRCKKECHKGECGECPLGLPRTCPCGKTSSTVPCSAAQVESCADTCQKPLSCGNKNHLCTQRCHTGDCGNCTAFVEKSCKCASTVKEYACSKTYTCETKCKNIKSCKKHTCNKKCCSNCPPCDKLCSKILSCGKHKCSSNCHNGNCYPCNIKQTIKCRCGLTTISILCGRGGKKVHTPNCRELCKLPSKCHHIPKDHYCHTGNCPKCIQVCDESIDSCGHLCKAKCHDFVKIISRNLNFKPIFPGEVAEEVINWNKLDHPPCSTKLEITCIGGHETSMLPCSSARSLSCGRPCGRDLTCGNHNCKKMCHIVDIKSDDEAKTCEECEESCSIPRNKGCSHPCSYKFCHPGPCKKCTVQIKSKCFCGLTDVYYRCCELNKKEIYVEKAMALERKVRTCGNRCIKNYPCGHQCSLNCHHGECSGANQCKKKVKCFCICKNRKVDLCCDKIRAEDISVIACDESCVTKKNLIIHNNQKKIKELDQIEAEKNLKELKEFELKFGKKKQKERKQVLVEEKKDYINWIIALSSFSIVLVALLMYSFIQ